MCGIAGIGSADPRTPPLDAEALRAMTAAIEHRGPDEDGHFLEPGVALGMRRLSVIDPAGSPQPVASEDGEVTAVFNGEIYNFRELREELRGCGHRFATDGDGETIVHLYEELGPRFVERLRGMFAIALWDRPRRRLVLARDRMGVKPLYVAETEAGLAFASEVKSLVAGGLVRPQLDPDAAELFMAWGYVPGPLTLFAGVHKLDPATCLVYQAGKIVERRRYWTPWDAPPEGVGSSVEEDGERLLELLRTATRARMVSDVPLGVMLSGGLDSSLITALMAEASDRPVQTFSVGFVEDAAANELADARHVANRLGTDHHELETSALDHPDLLDDALRHLEEPIADLSCVGLLLLSRLARETVTVALSGQGADELLGGYRKHQVAHGADLLRALPPARAAVSLAARAGAPESARARGLTALATGDPVERMLAMSRVVQPRERLALFTPEFLRDTDVGEPVRRHREELSGRSALTQTLYLDSRLALVDNMLLYFDKMSMATSLEVRVPFMDHDLVSFCFALPDNRKVRRGNRKELLKRVSRGLIDDEIIDKRKRGFFRSALGSWLRAQQGGLLEQTLLDPRTAERGLYRRPEVERLLQASGGGDIKADQRLFCLFLLERWMREWVDAPAPAPAAEPAVAL
ncbi:MAG TPA: asparagine synthase (glutamine-hydrolyzing) [Solirubrobacterales bacterium]|jgi:asparagine synthase (glutamine-hydrolysing)|nr:asparagine synthase (glutamine-hydrolyzing) [Solirubrobacterales bacterium]